MAEPAPTYRSGEIRDRLANERTLLAWVRTAMALMGFGLVVAKFGLFLDMLGGAAPGPRASEGEAALARAMGTALVLAGVVVDLLGAQRTRAYARIIDPEGRSPGDGVLLVTVAFVVLLGVGLALYLVFA